MASQYCAIAPGMTETRGPVAAIEAADAMTGAVEVHLTGRGFVGACRVRPQPVIGD